MRHLSTGVYILDFVCGGHKVEGNQNTLDHHRFHGFWEDMLLFESTKIP